MNNLTEADDKIVQPSYLKVELMQHQKTAVCAMKKLEQNGYVDVRFRFYDNEEKDLRIESNIGVLGDKVGSGKTLIMTTLMLESQPVHRSTYFMSNRYTTIKEIKTDSFIAVNVLLVPKGILHQWEHTFNNFVEKDSFEFISHTDATTKSKLDVLTDPKTTLDSNSKPFVVLCNEKTILDVVNVTDGKRWLRFIVDEADTLELSTLTVSKITASFIWLITGTTNGIQVTKKKYIRDIFGKNVSWQPWFLTIKNSNEYVDTSLNLPKPNRITIRCETPFEIEIVSEHIPANVMNMINAGNLDDAIRNLNYHVDTTDNIFTVIERNYQTAIKNKQIELEAEKTKKYDKSPDQKRRITKLTIVIDKLNKKLESLKNMLYKFNDTICPICMGDFEKPVLVECCGKKYCFTCISLIMKDRGTQCPFCQAKLVKRQMHVVNEVSSDDEDEDENENEDKLEKKNKMNVLCEIVKDETKTKRFLVFADYDSTFSKIKSEFDSKNVKYGILKGSGAKIKAMIEDFKKGKITVLMLNAKNFGAGLNLQCATDIIMYHRFNSTIEEQIIGRGQRIGRKSTLNVYYLIHDNENTAYNDKNMTDISHQEWLENLNE